MKSYEQTVKDRMVEKFPADLLGGKFRGKSKEGYEGYSHIFKKLKDNFIDGKYPDNKCIKGNLTDEKITYNCANHLNSSQAMCISFFKKFFENNKEDYLIKILIALDIDIDKTYITDAIFEYEPSYKEKN